MDCNLIIIEDEDNFAELISRALQGLTDSVIVVSTWEDAFSKIQNGTVAWADIRMPGVSDEDFIRNITKLRAMNPDAVIIVGSGHITAHMRAELDRAGVDGCFYKDSGFKAEQVASLIILGIMRVNKRHPHVNDKLLKRALEWMAKRYPETSLE